MLTVFENSLKELSVKLYKYWTNLKLIKLLHLKILISKFRAYLLTYYNIAEFDDEDEYSIRNKYQSLPIKTQGIAFLFLVILRSYIFQ